MQSSLRGKVAPTFEALSGLADNLAGQLQMVQTQLERSRKSERELGDGMKRLEVQKRALQVRAACARACVRVCVCVCVCV